MIRRWQDANLLSALKNRRAVHLTGARQCGKTTLASTFPSPSYRNITLDDAAYLVAAQMDPAGFVNRQPGETLIIDEVQKAPELLNAIKIQLDHDNSRGQYLLTGSSNLRFAKAVKDSLAGRLGTIRLRTLSRGEIQGSNGNFLKQAFSRNFPVDVSGFDKREIIRLAFCGGYPEVLDLKDGGRRGWFEDYIHDLLVKDIRDITEIRKVDALRKVANWLLAHSSKFFEMNDLCTKAQLAKETASNYLAALQSLYVFDGVAPWSSNDYARLGKRTKYFASDPGLVANLLGWSEERAYIDGDASRKLVETWVYHELASLVDLDQSYALTQYRDSDKREIDFIVEGLDDATLGIEVKAGSVVNPSDFTHLKWFARNLAKGSFTGIVLYTGHATLRFGEGFFAVPMGALTM